MGKSTETVGRHKKLCVKKSSSLVLLIAFLKVRDVLAPLLHVQCSLAMFVLLHFIVFFRYFFVSFFEMKTTQFS